MNVFFSETRCIWFITPIWQPHQSIKYNTNTQVGRCNTVKRLKNYTIYKTKKTRPTLNCPQIPARHSVWPNQQTRPGNEYYILGCSILTKFQDNKFLQVLWVKHCCDTSTFCRKEYDARRHCVYWRLCGGVWRGGSLPSGVDCGVGSCSCSADPAWGRGTPFPPLLLPCPFTFSSFALYYFSLFLFSFTLLIFFYCPSDPFLPE